MRKICSRCGRLFDENAVYCAYCGGKRETLGNGETEDLSTAAPSLGRIGYCIYCGKRIRARESCDCEAAVRASQEAKRRAEEETKRKAEEEAKRRAEEEAKRKAEEEAKRRAEEESKREAEEEAKRRAEEEAKRKAEEEAKRRAEEAAKRKAEEEAKRKAEEEAKRKAEEEAKRRAEEEKDREKQEIAVPEHEEETDKTPDTAVIRFGDVEMRARELASRRETEEFLQAEKRKAAENQRLMEQKEAERRLREERVRRRKHRRIVEVACLVLLAGGAGAGYLCREQFVPQLRAVMSRYPDTARLLNWVDGFMKNGDDDSVDSRSAEKQSPQTGQPDDIVVYTETGADGQTDAQVQKEAEREQLTQIEDEVSNLLLDSRYKEAVELIRESMGGMSVEARAELTALQSSCLMSYKNYTFAYCDMLVEEGSYEDAAAMLQEAYELSRDTEYLDKIELYGAELEDMPGTAEMDVNTEPDLMILNEDGTMSYDGHRYAIGNMHDLGITDYAELTAYCELLGGHLAVITSEAENYSIYQYIKNQGLTSAFFGYSDERQEGNWEWCNGETSDYRKWADGQPNNGANNEDGRVENYAQFKKDENGTWNDAPFKSNTVSFVCEWEYDAAVDDMEAIGDDSFYNDGTVVLPDSYILPESAQRELTREDVARLTHKGIRYAINEIYARHGFSFKTNDNKAYFGSQSWYDGGDTTDMDVVVSRMNDYEKKNNAYLAKMEQEIYGGEYPVN